MKLSIPAAALLALLCVSPVSAHEGHDEHDREHGAPFDPATARQTEFGIAGDPRRVTRVIELRMTDDMRFSPAALTIQQGETVRLSVRNNGKLLHEIVLETGAGLREHGAMMLQHRHMAHSAPNMLHVLPGQSGSLVWRFNKPGKFDFGCLQPGHFEAGMKGSITVRASAGAVAG